MKLHPGVVLLLLCWGSAAQANVATCQTTQAAAIQAMRAKASSEDPTAQLQLAALTGNAKSLKAAMASLQSAPATTRATALNEALAGAAWTGNQSALEALLAQGANPNATTDVTASAPIVLAAQCGHVEAMAALSKGGADLTSGSTPDRLDNVPRGALESAIAGDQAEAAEWLVDHGYEVCQGGERERLSALLDRLGPSTAMPDSLRAKLACQAAKEQ